MLRHLACASLLLAAACGPRTPPPKPGEVLFWRVTGSTVDFNGCTDDAQFREPLKPIAFDENTYLVYRVEQDGKKATALDCSTLSASTCQPSASGVVFEVAGNELFFARDQKTAITGTRCMLSSAQTWVLDDKGTALDMTITNVLSLTDAPTECAQFDEQVKNQSANKLGLQGCVVNFRVTTTLSR